MRHVRIGRLIDQKYPLKFNTRVGGFDTRMNRVSAGFTILASVAPSLPPDHESEGLYLTPPPEGPQWTSDLRERKKSNLIHACGPYVWILLNGNEFNHSHQDLTSPQASDTWLHPVGLARISLAWILTDYRKVLIPVAPIYFIHPEGATHHTLWLTTASDLFMLCGTITKSRE